MIFDNRENLSILNSMKKSQIVLIVVAVLILGILAFVLFKKPYFSRPINNITDIAQDRLPEKFPVNIPLEAGAKILKNYNAVSPQGRVQASRVFESTKPVAVNFDIYKNFVSQKPDDWKILYELNSSSQPDYKALFAKGIAGVLNITIRRGAQPGTSIVDISFLAAE